MSCEHPWIDPAYHIQWCKLTPERVKPDITYAIDLAKKKIEEICNLKEDEINFNSTFKALSDCKLPLDTAWYRLMQLDTVCDNPEQRKAIEEVQCDVALFRSSIYHNQKLWTVIKAASEKTENLSPVEKRYVSEVVLDFKENGIDLPQDKQERINQIDSEIIAATSKYSQNALDSLNAWELLIDDVKELDGLPQSALEIAAQKASDKGHPGKYLFTLHYSSRFPLLRYAKNEEIRKKVFEATANIGAKGPYDNEPYIMKILELRHEKAKILGFKNFADMVASRRMVKTGDNALKFVEDLHDKVKPQFLRETEELKKFQEKVTGQKVQKLKPWNVSYYSELLRKELYDFDEEEIKPYFSLDNVLKGLFTILNKLYDITITERKTFYRKSENEPIVEDAIEVWHPDCKFFEIRDNKTGQLLSSLYADFFPRSSKKSGAWQDPLVIGCPHLGAPHLGFVCTNISPPVGDKPALLSHYEVETVFHEFGHMTHQTLSEVPIRELGGTNSVFDFVEMPSQVMENWTWEKEALDLFAVHYQTGEKLPDELLQKLIRARNFRSATAFMGQLRYGKIDLELHINVDKNRGQTIDGLDDRLLSDYRIDYDEKEPSMTRNFHHLFAKPVEYAAGYYSYKWAEVLDAEIFTKFKKEGILNGEVGNEFRRKVLSKGNSEPADVLFRDFMGRDPSPDALLERSGIK
ncbi:oligopeptidase A [Histomonas meleagridis]|uniref:oligopeptidase A n=1 Tax=Histomonas meleagridis TaxID=135588 RepID=UPI003559E69C|nr:oligopeptidase A [Histomonas meleagridis]KAH0797333.1 oligopeptidase A [Histomonas meleagridis]